ncbi:hypothetical protein FH609_003450 [Streptomyces sp. 3MP-14]|uniref:Uncharacterized protein n=1 Tax=Streptomyces mimosae TaxID=2586635 RepID=A0A5N5ZXF0_9ACTN|nr:MULTISPECIES: hypothetical protein [Streptomyces]KAB8161211.1 hypothetical protein FH607_026620 [Streptomyces mimosae]KAB8179022.1 hypothetical protein FH609_003450 [Streptomyces sp. 3MP-14]
MTWTEADYVAYLEAERRRYAWVMRRHGGRTPERARAAALAHYPYEPADAPHRGLVFHDEAWHWAMLEIHGHAYWSERPDLERPPPEYRALS